MSWATVAILFRGEENGNPRQVGKADLGFVGILSLESSYTIPENPFLRSRRQSTGS